MQSSYDELFQALSDNLAEKGVLDKLRASLRAEAFHAIDGSREAAPPAQDARTRLLGLLIHEWLAVVAPYAASVAQVELQVESRARAELIELLGLDAADVEAGVPLLYYVLPQFRPEP